MKDDYYKISKIYDRVTFKYLFPLRRKVASFCKLKNWHKLLDIGCGTGAFAYDLAFQGFNVTGIDVSESMLSKAFNRKKNALEHVANKIDFILAELNNNLITDNYFDAAIAMLVLHESSNLESIIEQAFVCSTNLIVVDWRPIERNLDYVLNSWVPIVEFCCGKRHFNNYKHFCSMGGVNGISQKLSLRVVHEEMLNPAISLYHLTK